MRIAHLVLLALQRDPRLPQCRGRLENQLLSNWQLGSLISAHSGFPFTPLTGVDNSLTGVRQDRPNMVGDPYVRSKNTLVWLNPAAFGKPTLGNFGNLGPGTVFGPGFWTVNGGLSRIFKVKEAQTLEFRAEGTNVLNHANFQIPSSNLNNSATFGRIQSAGPGRVMQFGLKYLF